MNKLLDRIQKLRKMTVANGCTSHEEKTALKMIASMEGKAKEAGIKIEDYEQDFVGFVFADEWEEVWGEGIHDFQQNTAEVDMTKQFKDFFAQEQKRFDMGLGHDFDLSFRRDDDE